jgi:hypothetical protein
MAVVHDRTRETTPRRLPDHHYTRTPSDLMDGLAYRVRAAPGSPARAKASAPINLVRDAFQVLQEP